MMTGRIYLSPPFMCGNEKKYVDEAFAMNWIAPLGPNIMAFEREMCAYTGLPHAVACSSGTAAIDMCLRYLGVDTGDYVFCSTFTFSGSCNPIMYHKARPVFIDSEGDTWGMSPDALREALAWAVKGKRLPKACIVVDLYGQSAKYDEILPLCAEYGVPVIEDAAEAVGATYQGQPCGGFGMMGIYSFNGNKIITTSGGGMVVSRHEEVIKKCLFWATQARESAQHYEHKEYGYNYRMSNVTAGIGRGQLERLNEKIALRKEIFERYGQALKPYGVSMMPVYEKGDPNYWLSVAILPDDISPEAVCASLMEKNIEARPAWKSMHLQPVFKECPYFDNGGVAEKIFASGVCLPSGEALTREQQEMVVRAIVSGR